MAEIRIDTFVAAPPERVFDVARDLDFHQRSMAHTGERAVAGRTTGLIELGQEVEWEARHLGRAWRLRSRITEMDRPRSFTDEQVSGPFTRYHHTHTFVARDGGTLMIDDWRHVPPLGPLGALADVLFLARHMRRTLEMRAAAIKEEAERTASRSADPQLVKIRLHDRGEDPETPWAIDLGPAAGPPGARRVRLDNVPFLHAKPTCDDEIVVVPDADGFLEWDRAGVPFEAIASRLAHDSGRWAMILDWTPHAGTGVQAAWTKFVAACNAADCVPEGSRRPDTDVPGRAYLAVPRNLRVDDVLTRLRSAGLPMDLTLVHPLPD